MIAPRTFPHRGRGGGPPRTLDREALLVERQRIRQEEPSGLARTKALRDVTLRLNRIERRSLFK